MLKNVSNEMTRTSWPWPKGPIYVHISVPLHTAAAQRPWIAEWKKNPTKSIHQSLSRGCCSCPNVWPIGASLHIFRLWQFRGELLNYLQVWERCQNEKYEFHNMVVESEGVREQALVYNIFLFAARFFDWNIRIQFRCKSCFYFWNTLF